MLESTYIHCPGIGPKTERKFWQAGARTWTDFQALRTSLKIAEKQRMLLEPLVEESIARLAQQDHGWFARALPRALARLPHVSGPHRLPGH